MNSFQPTAEHTSLGRSFEVRVSHQPAGITVLTVTGDVDMATSPELEEHLERELRRVDCRRLVIDLRHTSFLSARGVECLLRARDVAERRDLELRLVISTRPVASPLDVLHLRAKFKINETLTGACSHEPS